MTAGGSAGGTGLGGAGRRPARRARAERRPAGRDDAADWIRRLREAALADEKGQALDGALGTIRSFST